MLRSSADSYEGFWLSLVGANSIISNVLSISELLKSECLD